MQETKTVTIPKHSVADLPMPDALEARLNKLITYTKQLVEEHNTREKRVDIIEHAVEHKQKPSTIRQLGGEDE